MVHVKLLQSRAMTWSMLSDSIIYSWVILQKTHISCPTGLNDHIIIFDGNK